MEIDKVVYDQLDVARQLIKEKDKEIERLIIDNAILREANTEYHSQLSRFRKALEIYANKSNWGNGGYEGHPSDLFMPTRCATDRAWKIAQEVLEINGKDLNNEDYKSS